MAVAANGAAIVALSLPGGGASAAFAFRPAGETAFHSPVRLSGAPPIAVAYDPPSMGVAARPDGSAVVLWDEATKNGAWSLYAVAISPAGVAGVPVKLNADDQVLQKFEVRVDGAGRVTATWQRAGSELRYAVQDTDGTWSTPVTLAAAPRWWTLAVAPSGEAYLSYTDGGDDAPLPLLHRASPTGSFTVVRDLAVRHGYSSPRTLEADSAGGFVAGWLEAWDGSTKNEARYAVQPPGGAFGSASVHPAGRDGTAARVPGATVLLGSREFPDPDDTSQTMSVGTAEVLPDDGAPAGAVQDVTVPGQVAVTSAEGGGRLVLGMIGRDPLTAQRVALAAFRGADGAWSTPHRVSDTLASPMGVSVAAAGDQALMAWMEDSRQIRVSSWSPGADPPPVPPTAPPATPAASPNAATRQGGPERTGAISGTRLTASLKPAWTLARGWSSDYIVQDQGRAFTVRTAGDGLEAVAVDVGDGHVLWTAPIDEGQRWDVSLAASHDTLIVASNGTISALDPATGLTRWQSLLPQPIPTAPMIVGDRVVLTTLFRGATAVAYSLADGHEFWRAPVPATFDATVADDRLMVAPVCALLTGRAGLRLSDGTRAWQTTANCPDGDYDSTGVFDGRWLWITSPTDSRQQGRVMDPATGRILRTFRGESPAFAPDGVGYRLVDGALVAFDSRSLATLWRFAAPGPLRSVPLVTDGLVSVQADDGTLYVLDRLTGAQRYAATVPRPDYPSFVAWPNLSAGDGHLIVPTATGIAAFAADPPADEPAPDDPPADEPAPDDPPVSGPDPSGTSRGGGPVAGASAPAAGGATSADRGAPAGGTPAATGGARPVAAARPAWQLTSRRVVLDGRRLAVGLRCTGRGACVGALSVRIGAVVIRSPRLRLTGGHRMTVRLPMPTAARRSRPRTCVVSLPDAAGPIRATIRRRVG